MYPGHSYSGECTTIGQEKRSGLLREFSKAQALAKPLKLPVPLPQPYPNRNPDPNLDPEPGPHRPPQWLSMHAEGVDRLSDGPSASPFAFSPPEHTPESAEHVES